MRTFREARVRKELLASAKRELENIRLVSVRAKRENSGSAWHDPEHKKKRLREDLFEVCIRGSELEVCIREREARAREKKFGLFAREKRER